MRRATQSLMSVEQYLRAEKTRDEVVLGKQVRVDGSKSVAAVPAQANQPATTPTPASADVAKACPFEHLLIAVDDGPATAAAIESAAQIAALGQTRRVTMVHVVERPGGWADGGAPSADLLYRDFARRCTRAKEVLADAAMAFTFRTGQAGANRPNAVELASPASPLEPDLVLTEGAAGCAIADAARERGASVIIMGTQHRNAFVRMMLGCVAEAVVRRAGCPVLVVPVPSDVGDGAHAEDWASTVHASESADS